MNTAQILFEQYKVLPKKIQKELKTLIENDDVECVAVSLPAFKKVIRKVKLLKKDKIEARQIIEIQDELVNLIS